MTGNGPGSKAARRSSCAESCSSCGMRGESQAACPSPFLELELLVDQFLELLERLGAADHPSVDEECRRPVDARLLAGLDVCIDCRLVLARIGAGIEFRAVETEIGGVLFQIGVGQFARLGKQPIVIRPEL